MKKKTEKKLKNVLIVEDEVQLAFILKQTLELSDYTVVAAENVNQAISHLKSDVFDCIVSDYFLPEESGEELFKYVKKKNIQVPFVFMTGSPDLKFAVDFLKEGGAEYISKPFNLNDFVDKVKTVIEKFQNQQSREKYFDSLEIKLAERLREITIYRDVFQSSIDGFFIMGLNRVVVKANTALSKITGFNSGVIHDEVSNILIPASEDKNKYTQGIEELEKNGFWQNEIRFIGRDKVPYDAFVTLSKIDDDDGEIFAYLGIVKDVTKINKMERQLLESLQNTNRAKGAIIFGLAKLAEARDPDTGSHLERIRYYCQLIAQNIRDLPKYKSIVNDEFIEALYVTAPLHDIGKVAIPDHILLKKGKLSPEEFEKMKIHTIKGAETLRAVANEFGVMEYLKIGIDIAVAHHEKWNGTGYPNGLKGEDIPLPARILSIADVYDALTTKRIYKRAFSHEETLILMQQERGKHFDPDLLDSFIKFEKESKLINKKFAS